MILDRERMRATTIQGTSPALHGRDLQTIAHEAATPRSLPASRAGTQLWRVIPRSSCVRFAVRRIAADPLRGWIRPAAGQLYVEDNRITAMNLLFDVRDARSHLDQDGDTVGLVDRLDSASRLRRMPIIRLHTQVTDRTPDLLAAGELVIFGSTVPIALPGRLTPATQGSRVVVLSAAACISLEELGLHSPVQAGADWLATDPIEIVLDTLWSRNARTVEDPEAVVITPAI